MTTLNSDLKKAVRDSAGLPVRLIDAETNEQYVLIPAIAFERFLSLFEDVPLSIDEQVAALRRAGKSAGWEDPEQDVYDDLDPRGK